jgi:hypothetical protein
LESITDFWNSLAPAVKAIGGILTAILGSGFGWKLWRRWRDRPRIRVEVVDTGLIGDDRSLVIAATNFGDRVTSLYPVIRMRGRIPNITRFWHPVQLTALFPSTQRERAEAVLKRFKIPLGRVSEPFYMEYDVPRDEVVRLEPHAGAQTIKAAPRYPHQIPFLVFFQVYEIRQEGRRRPLKIYMTWKYWKRTSRLRYWGEWLRVHMCGIPKPAGASTLEGWLAEKQARD